MAIRQPSRMPVFADRPLTAADYFAMPPTVERYELLDGRLVLMAAPTALHQITVGEIYVALRAAAMPLGDTVILSPIDVELAPKTVLQPDVIYIAANGIAVVQDHIMGAPDLVVEVASPGTKTYDVNDKLPVYAMHGVREAWIVDTRRKTVTVHYAADGRFVRSETVAFGAEIPSALVRAGDAGLGALV
jgi:Uma2 family endonuclease